MANQLKFYGFVRYIVGILESIAFRREKTCSPSWKDMLSTAKRHAFQM